jgi:hypothetical protein
MFAEPTINDFLSRIDWHVNQADRRAKRAVSDVRRKASASGTLNSGNTIVRCFEVVRLEFDSGVEAVLGELKRAVQRTDLDRDQLRDHAVERLMSFATMAKATAQTQEAARSSSYVSEQYADLDQHLNFLVRQFDVGFFDPVEPEIPPVANNSITVGNMTGNIAQGSPGANQAFNLNIEAAEKALATFEAALASVSPQQRLMN